MRDLGRENPEMKSNAPTNADLCARKRRARIVVVENDDNDAFFLERALQRSGFETPLVRLCDGQYAIDYFAELVPADYPDVVLLDLKMPRKDGFDVLQWMRQSPVSATLPIIILSSSDEPSDLRRAEDLRATKFLRKKHSYQDVIDTLEELLAHPPSH